MAGDWMKIELELSDKPEVHYIANGLNMDPDAVVGKLVRVWAWFDKHTSDGNALGVTYSLLDRITGVTGFGEMMCLAGWMEQKDKVLHMPKFDSHTSASAKKRAETNKRVANHRDEKRNADVTQKPLQKALPEKRREDIKEGAEAPDAQLWQTGIQILTKGGQPEKNARTILGKHYKTDKHKLAKVIADMAVTKPIDPVAYLEKSMSTKLRVAL